MNIFSDINYVRQISNHPVHILDESGKLSPSAFIPFCEFGGNMSLMGQKIDQFFYPVCNSFQEKILNNQLCYEVDPNKFLTSLKYSNVRLGLSLLLDHNEDRFSKHQNHTSVNKNIDGLGKPLQNI